MRKKAAAQRTRLSAQTTHLALAVANGDKKGNIYRSKKRVNVTAAHQADSAHDQRGAGGEAAAGQHCAGDNAGGRWVGQNQAQNLHRLAEACQGT